VSALLSPSLIVTEARHWINTPYQHQASLKGIGCDCLGLILGVWRHLTGESIPQVMNYSPHWAECAAVEFFAQGLALYAQSIPCDQRQIGDVLLFRWRPHAIAKHAGILTEMNHFIHAHERSGVCEIALSQWWLHRLAFVFRF
jgi:NlpC/P60 family putative phage cell wall peptidase